jgi:hypothetical protein
MSNKEMHRNRIGIASLAIGSRGALVIAATLVTAVGCSAEVGSTGRPAQGSTEQTARAGEALSLNAVTRESFDNQGRQGNGPSQMPWISPNQRYVVFESTATVWANGVNTQGFFNIYLKDRQIGSITLITRVNGVAGNDNSFDATVADNGTVAFLSNATNLAPGATATVAKVFVRTTNGVISQVDVTPSGGEPNGGANLPAISGDGSAVIFQSNASNLVASDTNGATDVFVASLSTTPPTITRVSNTQAGGQTNGASFGGTINYDGSVVAFASDASNILFNDGNNATDVFAVQLKNNILFPISFATTGLGGSVGNATSDTPQISGDGKTVSFRSLATNFAGPNPNGNGISDIFVNPVGSGRDPIRVSVSSTGAFSNSSSFQSAISFDGSAVAFVSTGNNLAPLANNGVPAHVFARVLSEGQTILVDQFNGVAGSGNGSALIDSSLKFSGSPSVPSASFLVFDSNANNLVSNDTNAATDVFSASVSP